MLWIIIGAFLLVILSFYVRMLLRGGNYGVITRNVTSWYIAFLVINKANENDDLLVSSFLEAAAIASQSVYIKRGQFSIESLKDAVDSTIDEHNLENMPWSEIKPSQEMEAIESLIVGLMNMIFDNDTKVATLDIMTNIDKNRPTITRNVHSQVKKKVSGLSINAALKFAEVNPGYLSGNYNSFR